MPELSKDDSNWRKTKVVLVKVVSWIIGYFHIRTYIRVTKLMVGAYK